MIQIKNILAFLLISFNSFGQKPDEIEIQFKGAKSPLTHNLAFYKKEVDSLGKAYNLKACGYTKTILDDRETLILFYRLPSGDMEEVIIYTRKLK